MIAGTFTNYNLYNMYNFCKTYRRFDHQILFRMVGDGPEHDARWQKPWSQQMGSDGI